MAYSISASIEFSVPSTICSTIGSTAVAARCGAVGQGLRGLRICGCSSNHLELVPSTGAMTRMPCGSTSTYWPGNTTVVEPNSSTTAGPSTRQPGGSDRAVVDRRVPPNAVEIDRAGSPCARGVARAPASFGICGALDHAEAGDAEIDQFDLLLAGVIIAEGSQMRGIEGADQPGEERGIDRAARRGDAHLHRLAGVAHVGFAHQPDARRPRCRRAPASRPRRAPAPRSARRHRPRSIASSCITLVTMWSVRQSTASRPNAERLPGFGGTMQAFMPSSSITAADCAGPAPPNDNSAKSRGSMPRWIVICRIALAWLQLAISMMPLRQLLGAHVARQAAWPALRCRSARALDIERDAAADQRRRNAAQHQIGIGDGRLVAAVRITHRPGLGAGAARADLEMAFAADPGDRAAAGADGLDVDHRDAHRERPDRSAIGDMRLAAFDQAEIGRGAAGIQRHQIGKAGDLRDHGAAERARPRGPTAPS